MKEAKNRFISQQELNRRADNKVKIIRAKLKAIYDELKALLDVKEVNALNESQETWEKYSQKQAEFAALRFETGSLRPLVFFEVIELLTTERISLLKSELKERQELS